MASDEVEGELLHGGECPVCGERIEQTSEDLVDDYEGLMVPCPFCSENDDIAGQPKPYLSLGKCHYCSREFEVIVRWEDERE